MTVVLDSAVSHAYEGVLPPFRWQVNLFPRAAAPTLKTDRPRRKEPRVPQLETGGQRGQVAGPQHACRGIRS